MESGPRGARFDPVAMCAVARVLGDAYAPFTRGRQMISYGTTHRPRMAAGRGRRARALTLAVALAAMNACARGGDAAMVERSSEPGAAGSPYPNMPSVAAIGERT